VITKRGKPVTALVPFEDWERRAAGAAGGLASIAPPTENLDSDHIFEQAASILRERAVE